MHRPLAVRQRGTAAIHCYGLSARRVRSEESSLSPEILRRQPDGECVALTRRASELVLVMIFGGAMMTCARQSTEK